jgi:hypothetical protein
MKFVKGLVVVGITCYLIAVGYNVVAIKNLDDKILEKNGMSLTLEVASRLGIVQTLGIIGDLLNTNDTSAVFQDSRFLKEFVNVLFDWYAPIKWSPVLSVSKEIGFFMVQNRLND